MASRKKMSGGAALALFLVFGFALAGGSIEEIGDAPPITADPACSDGIDNDGDGSMDEMGENECYYQSLYCPNWNSETVAPAVESDCI